MLQRCWRRAAAPFSLAVARTPRERTRVRHMSRREASALSYYHGTSNVPLLPLVAGDVVDGTADVKGDNVAVVSCHQGISKTYVQFKLDIDQLAAAFVSLGLPLGSMICIVSSNIYEWPVVQFAAAKAGLVLVNVNTAYQVPEMEHCLKLVDCEALILSEKFARQDYYSMLLQIAPELEHCKPGNLKCQRLPRLKHVILLGDEAKPGTITYDELLALPTRKDYATVDLRASQIRFDAPVNVQFTSGTTGKPKGALLSHFNIVNNANSVGHAMGLHEQEEVICLNVPMIHCFGCVIGSLTAAMFGSTIVMASPGFSAVASLEAIQKHRCTLVYGTPTMYIDMMHHLEHSQFDVSSLRKGVMAGAPCPPEVIKHTIDRMNTKRLHIFYGSTECSPVVTASDPDEPMEKWIHTVGRPLDHVEVKIVDDNNNIVPANTRGELCARGYLVFLEYYNEPDRTKEVVRDKWYHTGMSRAESQREQHTHKFLTPPATPKRVVAYQEKLKQTFNPSLFLQNFNFPIPFRRKPKPKASEENTVFPTPYKTLYHPRVARHQPFRRSEFIELANFGVVEIDPTESGVGHDFEPVVFKNPTWCDLCGDFVWGACSLQQGLQCQNCNFTCHLRCRSLVALDCKGQGEMETADLSGHKDEKNEENGRVSPLFLEDLPKDELLSRIESYNLQEPGLDMVLQEDGSVRGFVRVRMNLMRPINVVAGTRPPSIYNILKDDDSDRKTLTSFYLPRDTIKALHITSEYTVRELIVALLKKFKVADNPRKFALYESCVDESTGEVKLRKLQDSDKPLWLALDWNSRSRQFVLQENDNSDIEWEDFAIPELQNFLKILELEEEEYLTQLKLKYDLVRSKIQEAMDSFPKHDTAADPQILARESEASETVPPEKLEGTLSSS